jgi:ribosomal protein L11 methyltransferase
MAYSQRPADGPGSEIVFLENEKTVDDKLHALSRIVRRLERMFSPGKGFEFRVRNLAYSEPCVAEYREAFYPIPSLRIQPWGRGLVPVPDSRTVLIAAENAFGTGKHPSSRLCLRFLDEVSPGWGKGGRNILDFGCGTGLLAIAAVLLGAEKALGVETDAQSVQTAKKNVALNHLEERITIAQGSWKEVRGEFDLVLANLVPSVLLRSGCNIPKHLKAGGYAVIAGFGLKQMPDMARFFMDIGLSLERNMTLDDWGLLVMKRARG